MNEVHAAGAVLWRWDSSGSKPEVAVVHRPRYDDWTLPKGKQDPGESTPATAAREVLEETGFSPVLGRSLGRVRYPLTTVDGRSGQKVVDYYSARVNGGEFAPNDEVDALRWLAPEQAAVLLTRNTDRTVLEAFTALPPNTTTLLLVRHAKAGKRDKWEGDDDLRPLSKNGVKQAAALRALLPLYGPDRVFSAPRVRCSQTVEGVAEDLGAAIREEPSLSEEGYWPHPSEGVGRLLEIAAEGGTPLVCSQGGVIPHVVEHLARASGVTTPALAARKGSLWVLSFTTESGGAPVLVAADYLASPLPRETD
ncbi:NUDIX hydrolase [Allokutzneria sp. NRRL B-24872]|uniref:NUDIX hydrolase n=1 Tax=Allokutzneria sp. NRRL B-24872 TaxID=1137961 RepID=UPI001AEFB711|nr:NUDIX hydrolase [Allokutzneria sp. NRRL B-24872]